MTDKQEQDTAGLAEIKGWFVNDFADGWVFFDNEADALRQVEGTGAMMLIGFHPAFTASPAERFARWLEDGPKLAKAAGCYVGIKVSALTV